MLRDAHDRMDNICREIRTLEGRLDALANNLTRELYGLEERLSRLEQTPDDPSDITRAKLCNLLERLQDIRGELIELLETRLKHTDQQEKVEDNLRLMRGGAHSLYNLLNNYMRF